MQAIESKFIANQIDNTRELTRFYLSKLKDVDVYKSFEFNGIKLNPIIWEVGHLAVSQNWLVLYLGLGDAERIPWANQFAWGTIPPNNKADYPTYKEIWDTFKRIHVKSIKYVENLSDDTLKIPLKKDVPFTNVNIVKSALMHSIRHEGIHAGHLSWHCKLFGIKTI